ncbi:MAG: uridine diphosphate-N-acetylglucosamine-binding protein YvcK [Arcanobacterium sp.]
MNSLRAGYRGRRVVALGGGHGLYATLSALRILTSNVTAIVTVADDGGSSGRIREQMDVLPPGDLRMALSALCDDGEWGQTWRDVLQYRFESSGDLNGHSVGNLLIVATWALLDDQIAGLDFIGRLLDIKGRVIPMSSTPLEIVADVITDGQRKVVTGQVAVATSKANVERVQILPENPPAHSEAIDAVHDADWVIFGPGSWYTSIIPHLLVPDLADSLINTRAKRMLVLNLVPDEETATCSAASLVEAFHQHLPQMRLDVILVNSGSVTQWEALQEAADLVGAQLVRHRLESKNNRAVHDPLFLAAAFREVFDTFTPRMS